MLSVDNVLDPSLRRLLFALIKRGELTIAEAADYAMITRQAMRQACLRAGLSVEGKRARFIARRIERLKGARLPSKAELRSQADEARDDWQWKQPHPDQKDC